MFNSASLRTPLIYFILIILCLSLYANSLNNAFVGDDIEGILENSHISEPWRYWLEPNSLLNSIGYLIQGYNPFIQHLINIILHSVNTILVFLFLRLFFKPDASFLGACIFAAHPIHTEAVTHISGRGYLIIALFIFTTFLLYNNSINPNKTKSQRAISYISSLVLFSYFSIKSIGFFSLTPLLLILSDVTFNRWRKNWKLWIPFINVIILNTFLARNVIVGRVIYTAEEIGRQVTWSNPVFSMAYSFFTHMGLLIWPARLTLYHKPVTIGNFGLIIEVFSLLLLLAISIFFLFRKSKELFFALGLFVLFLMPTYSPFTVSYLVAERYLYFPSIALSMIISLGYENYVVRKQAISKKAFLVLSIFLILAYGLRTVLRNKDWKTPFIFWKRTVEVSPGSGQAHNGLALVYFEKGDIERAIKHYNKAIEIRPDYAKGYNNRANTHKAQGNLGQAILDYSKAIEIKPSLAEAYYNRGNAHKAKGNLDQAILDYNKAIEIDPNLAEAYNNRGNAYKAKGNLDQALFEYSEAIEIRPNYAKAYNNRGIVYQAKGSLDQALLDFNKAIEIKPDYAIVYFGRALAYFEKQEYSKSWDDVHKAESLGYKVNPEFLKLLEPYRD